MKTKSPDHRYLAVSAAAKKHLAIPEGLREEQLSFVLSGKDAREDITRAHDIFDHEYKRETLEAMLLAGCTSDEVNEILRVPVAVTEAYSYLFFDVAVFADELDLRDYAYTYAGSEYGADLKKYTVDLGKECLKVRLSHGNYAVAPLVVQDGIRSTAYMMAQLVKVNQADSSLANAALRWAQVGLKAADPEDHKSEDDAFSKIKFALESREDSVNEQTSGISPDQILH